MNEYEVEVTLRVLVQAPSEDDVEDMVDDHYGLGSGGEGVHVTRYDYKFI